MRTKSFIVCGIVGGIVNFLLGWLFYGTLFVDFFPMEGEPNYLFLFLGGLFFALLISYIFTMIGNIVSPMAGLMTGAVIGILYGTSINFFMNGFATSINYETFALDIVLSTVITALIGATVALVNGKLK